MPKLAEHQHLYVFSMGKALRVTALYPDTEDGARQANAQCARSNDAVVAVMGGCIMLADKGDRGRDVPRYSLTEKES